MTKKLKCTECGGDVKYVEEVKGSFVYTIYEDGCVNFDDHNYYGDSWIIVECADCGTRYDYEWSDPSLCIKLKSPLTTC